MTTNMVHNTDAETGLKMMPDRCVQMCVTSPPYYGLRDYGHAGQIGLEETPEAYVGRLVDVFREVRRVLKDDGVLWLNLGDSYAGWKIGRDDNHTGTAGINRHNGKLAKVGNNGKRRKPSEGLKPKDLIGIPWLVAFALRADGWYLRQDIIWHKPNPTPESVKDRCTKAHEYMFLLSKSERYYYDSEAIAEKVTYRDENIRDRDAGKLNKVHGRARMNGLTVNNYETRNKRSVWTIPPEPYPDAHFATYPPDLIVPCIKAGSKAGDIVLDPFMGSGTTAEVALRLERKYVGFEINPEYMELIEKRLRPHKHNLFSESLEK